jgi:hypothetical protein
MVSARLVHQIEEHWEAVSARFLRVLRGSHSLPHVSKMPESEITETCRRILHRLGHWLVSSSEDEIARHYQRVGEERFAQHMPLSEAIRAMQIMKDVTMDYIQDEFFVQSSVDLYAEEELERQLGRFYDLLIYHLARGYEEARSL